MNDMNMSSMSLHMAVRQEPDLAMNQTPHTVRCSSPRGRDMVRRSPTKMLGEGIVSVRREKKKKKSLSPKKLSKKTRSQSRSRGRHGPAQESIRSLESSSELVNPFADLILDGDDFGSNFADFPRKEAKERNSRTPEAFPSLHHLSYMHRSRSLPRDLTVSTHSKDTIDTTDSIAITAARTKLQRRRSSMGSSVSSGRNGCQHEIHAHEIAWSTRIRVPAVCGARLMSRQDGLSVGDVRESTHSQNTLWTSGTLDSFESRSKSPSMEMQVKSTITARATVEPNSGSGAMSYRMPRDDIPSFENNAKPRGPNRSSGKNVSKLTPSVETTGDAEWATLGKKNQSKSLVKHARRRKRRSSMGSLSNSIDSPSQTVQESFGDDRCSPSTRSSKSGQRTRSMPRNVTNVMHPMDMQTLAKNRKWTEETSLVMASTASEDEFERGTNLRSHREESLVKGVGRLKKRTSIGSTSSGGGEVQAFISSSRHRQETAESVHSISNYRAGSMPLGNEVYEIPKIEGGSGSEIRAQKSLGDDRCSPSTRSSKSGRRTRSMPRDRTKSILPNNISESQTLSKNSKPMKESSLAISSTGSEDEVELATLMRSHPREAAAGANWRVANSPKRTTNSRQLLETIVSDGSVSFGGTEKKIQRSRSSRRTKSKTKSGSVNKSEDGSKSRRVRRSKPMSQSPLFPLEKALGNKTMSVPGCMKMRETLPLSDDDSLAEVNAFSTMSKKESTGTSTGHRGWRSKSTSQSPLRPSIEMGLANKAMSLPRGLHMGEVHLFSDDDSLAEVKAFFRAVKETSKIESGENAEKVKASAEKKKTKIKKGKRAETDGASGIGDRRSSLATERHQSQSSWGVFAERAVSPSLPHQVDSVHSAAEQTWENVFQEDIVANSALDVRRGRPVSLSEKSSGSGVSSPHAFHSQSNAIGKLTDEKRRLKSLSPARISERQRVQVGVAHTVVLDGNVQTLLGDETTHDFILSPAHSEPEYRRTTRTAPRSPSRRNKSGAGDHGMAELTLSTEKNSKEFLNVEKLEAKPKYDYLQRLSGGGDDQELPVNLICRPMSSEPKYVDYIRPLSSESHSVSCSAEFTPSFAAYLGMSDGEASKSDASTMNANDLLQLLGESSDIDFLAQSIEADEPSIAMMRSHDAHDNSGPMHPKMLLAFLEASNKEDPPEKQFFSNVRRQDEKDRHVMTLEEMADILQHVSSRNGKNENIRFDVIGRMAFRDGGDLDPFRPCDFVGGGDDDEKSDDSIMSEISMDGGMDLTTDFWNSGGSFQW